MFTFEQLQQLQAVEAQQQKEEFTTREPFVVRVAKRATWEIAKFSVSALVACFILFGIYRAGEWTVNTAHAAASVVRVKMKQTAAATGITFAEDFRTAAPMDSIDEPSRNDLDQFIQNSARAYDHDPDLIKAIVQVESSGNPRSVSETDARGLMQLTPGTRKALGMTSEQAHDPAQGIEGGSYWLRKKIQEQNGNIGEAIQSYFCGTSRVDCLGQPKGIRYLKKVQRQYLALKYSAAFADAAPLTPSVKTAKRVG